uniref:Uncharacterized protein n=1 Tax=Cannabis sativa TaxID=3483 RepID=A0A803QQK5_CANSA
MEYPLLIDNGTCDLPADPLLPSSPRGRSKEVVIDTETDFRNTMMMGDNDPRDCDMSRSLVERYTTAANDGQPSPLGLFLLFQLLKFRKGVKASLPPNTTTPTSSSQGGHLVENSVMVNEVVEKVPPRAKVTLLVVPPNQPCGTPP